MQNLPLFPETVVTDIHQFAVDCIVSDARALAARLDALPLAYKVNAINAMRELIHARSPFKSEPVDFVRWIPADQAVANDYNPNSVAPPEMKLLEVSILEDGYTQPIVSWARDGINEVVDGFHRHRVGKESKEVAARIQGYLPVVVINDGRTDLTDRMASTIRHNRARGKHRVEATDLEHAVKAARRQCKTFTLPGWRLHCREADKDFAVVQFMHPDGSKEFA